jgi:hypothetical protein
MRAELRERKRVTGLKNKGFINGNGCENGPPLTGLNGVSEEKGSKIPPALDQA